MPHSAASVVCTSLMHSEYVLCRMRRLWPSRRSACRGRRTSGSTSRSAACSLLHFLSLFPSLYFNSCSTSLGSTSFGEQCNMHAAHGYAPSVSRGDKKGEVIKNCVIPKRFCSQGHFGAKNGFSTIFEFPWNFHYLDIFECHPNGYILLFAREKIHISLSPCIRLETDPMR